MSSERLGKLLDHQAFGYNEDNGASGVANTALCVDSVADDTCASEIAMIAELEARRSSLLSDLEELEVSFHDARERMTQVSEHIAERQQEMAKALDEHAACSKALADARSRSVELEREESRIKEALAQVGSSEDTARRQPKPEDVAVTDMQAARDTAAVKLSLHCAYLVQLEEENQHLKQQCSLLLAT